MEKHSQTFLQIVNHVMISHPELTKAIRDIAQQRLTEIELVNLPPKDVFSKIYREGLWGKSGDFQRPFYSGSGSHSPEITSNYISAVSKFLNNFSAKPNVLDLGCGDFYIGSQIRSSCDSYIACDIVEELINFNKKEFSELEVDFRILDITENTLPNAEIIFVRQVLQHLSNAQIKSFLTKVTNNYNYLIVTEHIPLNSDFPHNIDHKFGRNIRLSRNSGVVLTSAPFNLNIKEEKVLCEVQEGNGVIKTIAYRL